MRQRCWGVLARFWTLIIFVMINASKAMREGTSGKRLRDHIALLLALAQARLDFALWRQAYRRLGWHPRAIEPRIFPPATLWPDTRERIRSYTHAFRNMNHVVEACLEDLRERYDISEFEAASCTAYAPLRTPLATRPKSSLAVRLGGYPESDPALGVPDPIDDVGKLGGKRWQFDFWFHVITAALTKTPQPGPPRLSSCPLATSDVALRRYQPGTVAMDDPVQ